MAAGDANQPGVVKYYQSVVVQAGRDALTFGGDHFAWAIVVALATYGISVGAGAVVSVRSLIQFLVLPLAGLVAACLIVLIVCLVRAPVVLARSEKRGATGLLEAASADLTTVGRERDELRAQLDQSSSREAIAARLDEMAHEYQQLKNEIPSDLPGVERSAEHLLERVKSELRMHADGFLDYWGSNPDPLPEYTPDSRAEFWEAYCDLSVEQLNHMASCLRAGRDLP